jgi:hypothetical protein
MATKNDSPGEVNNPETPSHSLHWPTTTLYGRERKKTLAPSHKGLREAHRELVLTEQVVVWEFQHLALLFGRGDL